MTCLCISELSAALQEAIDPIFEPLLSNLLKMAGQTKKIVATVSQNAVTAIITNSSYHTKTLQLLWTTIGDKNVSARSHVIRHLATYIQTQAKRHKHAIEAGGGLEFLEKSLRKGLEDPTPGVRDPARALFWEFQSIWPSVANKLKDSLDLTAKKGLERTDPNKSPSSTSASQAIKNRPSMRELISARRPASRTEVQQPRRVSSSVIPSAAASSPSPPPPVPRVPAAHVSTPTAADPEKPKTSAAVSSSERPRPQRPSSMYGRLQSTTPTKPTTPQAASAHQRSSSTSSSSKASSPARPLSPGTSQRLRSPPSRSSPLRSSFSQAQTPASTTAARRLSATPRSDALSRSRLSPAPSSSPGTPSRINGRGASAPPTRESPRVPSPDLMNYRPPTGVTQSPRNTSYSSTNSNNNLMDMSFAADDEVVEDAMRAQAEQAESTAERFLELAEPDDDDDVVTSGPPFGPEPTTTAVAETLTAREQQQIRLPAATASGIATTPAHHRISLDFSVFDNSPPPTTAGQTASRLTGPPARESWWLKQAECKLLAFYFRFPPSFSFAKSLLYSASSRPVSSS
jgi:CLIP-associating protein 1/2